MYMILKNDQGSVYQIWSDIVAFTSREVTVVDVDSRRKNRQEH